MQIFDGFLSQIAQNGSKTFFVGQQLSTISQQFILPQIERIERIKVSEGKRKFNFYRNSTEFGELLRAIRHEQQQERELPVSHDAIGVADKNYSTERDPFRSPSTHRFFLSRVAIRG